MIVERLNRTHADAVELDDLRAHARLTEDYDDAEIARMGRAAAREAEDFAQIALLNQTIRVTLECCPRASTLPLPIAPLLDWSTVEVTADGVAIEGFSIMTGQRPAIRLTGPRPSGGMVIEYQAGFGADAASLPDDLREAILNQALAYYDARGPGDGKTIALSPHFTRIVGRYRRVRL